MTTSAPIKKDPLWVYDNEVVNWIKGYDFRQAVYGDTEKIIEQVSVRYRPMNKEFAEAQFTQTGNVTTVKKNPVQMQTDMKDIFPRISVSRINLEMDINRSLGKGQIRKWACETNGEYGAIDTPKAYNFAYQIDIETRQSAHALNILALILLDLEPDKVLNIPIGGNVGNKYCHVLLQGFTDNSNLELTENQDVNIRNTLDLLLEGWLYKDQVTKIEPVKLIDIWFSDIVTGEELDILQIR